ncbi:MAG: replication-relaxation family protein [Microgenomates group bacterium]|jgi:hypothetical protein
MTLPKITNKQQETIKLTYQFRFINRIQIQKLLNHKDKKTINLWLKDLTQKDYLKRIYDGETFGKNTIPAIYYLSLNGINFLKAQEGFDKKLLQKIYQEKNRSEAFIADCQFLADMCLNLKNQSKNGVSYDFVTTSDYISPDSPYNFLCELTTQLIFTKQKKTTKTYHLLEILNTTLPKYQILKRVKDYISFLLNYEWMEHFKSAPRILFICQTKELLISTKRMTKRLLADEDLEDIHISFALEDEVRKQGVTTDIWEEAE